MLWFGRKHSLNWFPAWHSFATSITLIHVSVHWAQYHTSSVCFMFQTWRLRLNMKHLTIASESCNRGGKECIYYIHTYIKVFPKFQVICYEHIKAIYHHVFIFVFIILKSYKNQIWNRQRLSAKMKAYERAARSN